MILPILQRPCTERFAKAIDLFNVHQRFDDGDFKAPVKYPFHRSCYGKHTCMWGVIRLAKGLLFIPVCSRTAAASRLLNRCIDSILLHEVCFASHDKKRLIHRAVDTITFPSVARGDFLEVLWIPAREGIKHPKIKRALHMLESKMTADGQWTLE